MWHFIIFASALSWEAWLCFVGGKLLFIECFLSNTYGTIILAMRIDLNTSQRFLPCPAFCCIQCPNSILMSKLERILLIGGANDSRALKWSSQHLAFPIMLVMALCSSTRLAQGFVTSLMKKLSKINEKQ